MSIFSRDYLFVEQFNAVNRAQTFVHENDEFVALGAIVVPLDFIHWVASLSWWIKIPIYIISLVPLVCMYYSVSLV